MLIVALLIALVGSCSSLIAGVTDEEPAGPILAVVAWLLVATGVIIAYYA